MLTIKQISDIHMEIDPYFYPINNGCDVLIIGGDYTVASYFNKSDASPYYWDAENCRDSFKRMSDDYRDVIYIPGNHESYKGYFDETDDILANELSKFTNVHYLQNKSIIIDGFKFIGGTLWTNCYNNNPIAMQSIRHSMNDYRIIQWKSRNYTKFSPDDSIIEHNKTLEFISKELENTTNAVVVTHHAPSYKSIADVYKNDYYMNSAYYSDLDNFILDRPQIKLWTHGHMHNSFDYNIGGTRVVCNPKGYKDENKHFNPDLIIEL